MRGPARFDMRTTSRTGRSADLQDFQELLTAFKLHGLEMPVDRLQGMLQEHQTLREHRHLVNELASQVGPSHIGTRIARRS